MQETSKGGLEVLVRSLQGMPNSLSHELIQPVKASFHFFDEFLGR
jgi:hypothetical protein